MERALIIGGTRFIGRHLVEEFLDNGYEVTLFNRGKHPNPFAKYDGVQHVKGDRASGAAIAEAAEQSEAQVVVDTVAYYPGEVELATRWLDGIEGHDVEAYVYISSGSAYGVDEIPKREGETPLEPCTDEQAVDDSHDTYGARKAEGDRMIFEAAEHGFPATSVRPTIVYGSHDYTGRFNYWVERVRAHDRILVPGDGTNIHHLVAVENVARAIRAVAEEGESGEVYNVGDRRVLTLGEVVETIADVLDRDVELVPASARELAAGDLEPTDFPLYNPDVHVLSTAKLADIGWDPLSPREAFERAIEGPVDPERDPGPERDAEERVIDSLTD
ncbi:epimerase [Halobacteriales archaeon QH_2_65_14]|nr:MAG: epimerase [Halobacteriales archaeon QH_2_65_14]